MVKYSLRVIYPLESGRIVLRTDQDWDRDIEPERWDSAEGRFEFQLETDRSFLYFKPVLLDQGKPRWSQGENYLAIASTPRTIYPHFQPDSHCSVCELQQLESHQYRVFFPPGYEENRLKRYPVLYMHDGQNLFFPEEAFLGSDWMIGSTLTTLEAMNMIDRVIVVGIHPLDRMVEYTRDGYLEYGRFIVEALKPRIDATYRTLRDPAKTAVMGSSLGGVASLYLSWQWPEVFGNAACLSSTFTYNDDLMERVSTEPMRKIRLYLDSGWPGDNYEVTRAVRDLLVRRGYQPGVDLMDLAFPNALGHAEPHPIAILLQQALLYRALKMRESRHELRRGADVHAMLSASRLEMLYVSGDQRLGASMSRHFEERKVRWVRQLHSKRLSNRGLSALFKEIEKRLDVAVTKPEGRPREDFPIFADDPIVVKDREYSRENGVEDTSWSSMRVDDAGH